MRKAGIPSACERRSPPGQALTHYAASSPRVAAVPRRPASITCRGSSCPNLRGSSTRHSLETAHSRYPATQGFHGSAAQTHTKGEGGVRREGLGQAAARGKAAESSRRAAREGDLSKAAELSAVARLVCLDGVGRNRRSVDACRTGTLHHRALADDADQRVYRLGSSSRIFAR